MDEIRLFPVGEMEELPEHGKVNVLFIQCDQVNYLEMIINTVNEVLRVTGTTVSHFLIVLGVGCPKWYCTAGLC